MLYNLMGIRKEFGLSRKEAAEQLGVQPGTYRNWEQCVNMPRDNAMIKRIADFFDVPMEALFGYDMVEPGAFSDLPENRGDRHRMVPVFATISAGRPDDQDEILGNVPIPMELMSRHPKAFLFRVSGTSMNRVLPDGCYALVDPERIDVLENHAYAVKVNGDLATVKRMRRADGGWELVPDSLDPTWKPITVNEDNGLIHELAIIGEVVWYTLPFDWSF